MRPLLEGTVIAAAVSMAAAAIVLVSFPRAAGGRYAGAIGLAAGYVAAFARMEPHHWVPALSWHWIPWLVAVAALIGPVTIASGVGFLERWAVCALVAAIAAWLLVPTRASLQPMRMQYLAIVAGSLILLGILLDPLSRRQNGIPLCVALILTLMNATALVAYGVSLRIGALGMIGVAALAGGGLAALWKRDGEIIRGLLAGWGIILAGVLLTAQLNDGLKLPAIALLAISPLMLWLLQAGPLARLSGPIQSTAIFVALATPLAGAWAYSLL